MASVSASTGFQLLSAMLLWLLLLSPVDSMNQSNEVQSLLSFKDTFSSANLFSMDYFITWLQNDDNPCSWIGVTCTANSTVSELDLSGWGLYPTPPWRVGMLSNLRDLRYLDLSSNSLVMVPEGIDNLTGLTVLDLSQNRIGVLEGLGGIGKLTRLKHLDLSGNLLEDVLSLKISSCRSLRSLYLHDNNITDDLSSLLDLVELQILLLANNRFIGLFPKVLGELSSLVTLDLSYNSFSGSIPALPNLTKLVELKLDNNIFTDFEKPWFLGAIDSLQVLSVSFNQLNGSIPSNITNLLMLQMLNMSGNRLSGDIPFGFSRQLENAVSLDLSQNQLTGNIPPDMLQQSNYNTSNCVSQGASYNLSWNLLTGSIPNNSAAVFCIDDLDISHNALSGSIPRNIFGDGAYLGPYLLWLHNNQLSGDIVDVLNAVVPNTGANYGRLEDVRLQHNLFTGDLSQLSLRGSPGGSLDGSLDYRTSFPQSFDVSNNYLRWSTSDVNPDPIQSLLIRVSTLTTLQEFRVGGNNFRGTSLPTTCFVNRSSIFFGLSYTGPLALDLSNSQLNGEILGAAFSSSCLPHLQFLNVSNNNIAGSVPQSIVEIPALDILDISDNKHSGRLPSFSGLNSSLDTDPIYFRGNDGLCGYPLDSCGGSRLQWWVLLISVGGSMAVALISCLGATWRWRVYRKRHQQDADLIKMLVERDAAALMPLRELRKATDNFADSAQIGQGGFGTVYVGKLDNGTMVAIKRSKREGSEQDKEQFLNEVRILSQVNHRNLVKLIGCCLENRIAVLVFEFVSNGTLQQHLQGKIGAVRLTWKQRVNIAVQTADALNYLHSAATFPIYHRDVKSANILLDDALNAKVADFGISRLAPLQATHVSTVVQGTFGYIDPEYYIFNQLTDKSDVYSFGVVLLELISAKPVLDFLRGGDESNLVNFGSPYIARGDLEGLVDPALMETYIDLAGHGRESILSVGRLAVRCADMRSRARPSMNEVLKELQSLWLKLSRTPGRTSTEIDSDIKSDDDWDAHRDHGVLLSEAFSRDSSTFTTHSDASGIQLSQLLCSRSASFK